MILEKQKEANVLVDGQSQESIGMSLDLDSAQILMQMLSKNLYSDDIGSAIRECASNALDSHRRAGVDEPIVVSFKASSYNNYEFCVEDFGIGLDGEDVKNIISKYGKSTKRNSATELGMMGQQN
jgi:HSP90 family molecular chaperone